MQLISLFPTGVGIYQLERSLSKTETNFIQKLERRNNTGNQTSVDNYVFNNKQLKSLHKFCLESANNYFKDLWKPKNELSLYITQSWVNYTGKDQFHHKHAHPNSFISGVFYVNANDGKDKIHFFSDNKHHMNQIRVFPTEYNQFNSETWWLSTGTGKLILFPSSLEHMVEKITTDEERISLSFNTFIKGPIGENYSLTELVI
jgi:uncharacterized protein (TIGR02466 family)